MADEQTPDFRNMTIKDLREGITALNKIIKELKEFEKKQKSRFWISWGAGSVTAAVVTAIFPPAGLMVAATATMISLDPAAGSIVSGHVVKNAESLRQKFKTVYRARPGRAFHDVAARREKERQRKRANRKFKFPGFG